MIKTFSLAGLVLVFSAGAALAHPGEHAFSMLNSLAHLLTEPDHLAMLAIAGAVAVLAWRHFRKPRVL